MRRLMLLGTLLALVSVGSATAQAPSAPPLPPATKLEAFSPTAGSVMTVGDNDLGTAGSVSVHAKEFRDSKSGVVRGLTVEVDESQYRRELSLVDTDEIPELLKGIDAILDVKANPTTYRQFEIHYRTRGALQVVVYSSAEGKIGYIVQAGRVLIASAALNDGDMRKFRGMVAAGLEKLSAASP